MLVTFFIDLAYNIVSFFLNLFPTADTSAFSNFTDSIIQASGYLSAVDNIVPVTTIMTIVGIFIFFETVILIIKIINWIIRKIPTIS